MRQPLRLLVVALAGSALVALATILLATDEGTLPATDVVLPTEATAPLPTDAPVGCPLTVPTGDFEPPDRYTQGFDQPPRVAQPSAEDLRWYGNLDLWTVLSTTGDVIHETKATGDFARRYFLWSVHQESPRDEPRPDVVLTAERLDGEGPTVRHTEATHGFTGDNLFMITGLVLPEPGCWHITAEYRGHDLTWTIRADPEPEND